jgi:pyruvate/2-oxoglutarate dehydrogenase complex dihydrolipoamide acyltransferase (E2) component
MAYYRKLEHPSSFRKLAAAMWRKPNDPHIFGFLDIDMTRALAFLEEYNRRNGVKVTVTHLITRALALVFAKFPETNAKVGFARILLRNRIDIFCQVSTDSGRDLSGAKIEAVDRLSLRAIAEQLSGSARAIRADQDPAFRRSRGLFKALPLWALRGVLKVISFMANTLSIHLPKAGMPRDPFGSAMVTSVGMFGIDSGFAPFTPIARCPIILTVTRVKPRPWVIEDRVVPRPVLRLCGTFDHRVIDGYHAGAVSSEIDAILGEPERLLTEEEAKGWTA